MVMGYYFIEDSINNRILRLSEDDDSVDGSGGIKVASSTDEMPLIRKFIGRRDWRVVFTLSTRPYNVFIYVDNYIGIRYN